MKRILGIALVLAAGGLVLSACASQPMCGPGADVTTKCDGLHFDGGGGSGTYVPTGGFNSTGGGSGTGVGAGGAGGSDGAGGAGGKGGVGGSGGVATTEPYLDEEGYCRSSDLDEAFGCAPTYGEALGVEPCGSPNQTGVCGLQLVVETPCPPWIRCAYNAETHELEGVVWTQAEPLFCDGQATTMIYGEACTTAIR